MKRFIVHAIGIFVLAGFLAVAMPAADLHKTFPAKGAVKIALVSGDGQILAGEAGQIKVDVTYTYSDDEYKALMEEKGDVVELREEFRNRTSHNGKSTWRITLPPGTRVQFSSASGDLQIKDIRADIGATTASGDVVLENLNGKVEIHTASGDITVNGQQGELTCTSASGSIRGGNLNGTIHAKSASGDIVLHDVKGRLEMKSASGSVQMEKVKPEGACQFTSASGDVTISLAASPDGDLSAKTATGDVTLKYNGNDLKGLFELYTTKKHGTIRSSETFDSEEELTEGDSVILKKTIRRGTAPKIVLKTATGTAALEK